jgi:hypothetical protein
MTLLICSLNRFTKDISVIDYKIWTKISRTDISQLKTYKELFIGAETPRKLIDYFITIGFTGEPVPPSIFSGATVKKKLY